MRSGLHAGRAGEGSAGDVGWAGLKVVADCFEVVTKAVIASLEVVAACLKVAAYIRQLLIA